MYNKIVILDFGAQYSQLIAKQIRKIGVYSIILPCDTPLSEILEHKPLAIILSGGPASIYQAKIPKCNPDLFETGIPILGICYGLQLIIDHFEGKIISSPQSEYGLSKMTIIDKNNPLFKGFDKTDKKIDVWMSHGDEVYAESIPSGFKVIATTQKSVAAVANQEKKIYGVQFHPEVTHTENGNKVLSNFVLEIAGMEANWNMPSFIEEEIRKIRKQVGDKKVILALSGGVDSSVLAVFLHQAINDQLLCVFVDNGLLRKGEVKQVVNTFRENFSIPLKHINARKLFLKKLRWTANPERKRRIIGKLFIKILKKESKGFYFLAQGTLYPDVIESVSSHGHSKKIKTHHNRVKQVLKMQIKGRLIEPFAQLFKDEVREIGKQLALPEDIINRQPFPGPGLAVRIIGRVTIKRLIMLKKADFIFQEKIKKHPRYKEFWQSFAILLPVKSVGVVGDNRSYGYTIVLRIVSSHDGMTADFEILEKETLAEITNKIVGAVQGITRVVLDITSKPPATIEWE